MICLKLDSWLASQKANKNVQLHSRSPHGERGLKFENGLLVAEPLAVLNDIGHVVDASGVRRPDGHLARDAVILGHGELFGQRSLAINAVAGLMELDRIIGITTVLRRAILSDKADETAFAENSVQAGLHVGHGRRDESSVQRLRRVVGRKTVGACNHDLRGAKVIAS